MENNQHNHEQQEQQQVSKPEEKVTLDYPSRSEIEKESKEKKVSTQFTETELNSFTTSIQALQPALDSAEGDSIALMTKNIELIIESGHKPFLRSYKEFKKSYQGNPKQLFRAFVSSCTSSLHSAINEANNSNEKQTMKLNSKCINALKNMSLCMEDLILIGIVVKMSMTRKRQTIAYLTKKNKRK
ncbi:hypothetical protein P3646_06860 [Vibrio parahaemolyticus]|nr:hypothetical protein [Vibrio parahaemolyticus]